MHYVGVFRTRNIVDKHLVYRYDDVKGKGFFMSLKVNESGYDKETGLPLDKKYLECNLPPYLRASLDNMIASWELVDNGGTDLHWDIWWCDLNADINDAEVNQEISNEQAWYLREKYLRMKRGD